MSPRVTRFICCAVALLLAACEDETPPEMEQADAAVGAQSLAELASLGGEVRLERGGQTFPASAGPLYKGDAVETGSDGSATVRLADGRSVEVGPNARFLLGQDEEGLVLEVSRGIVLSRVPAGGVPGGTSMSLRVLTPFGLTRIGTGASEVSFEVREGGGQVDVRVGNVEFVGANGASTRAEGGQSLTVAAGQVEVIQRVPQILELAPIRVSVSASPGAAEVRRKGSTRWQPVKGEGAALEAGDAVRTRRGSALLALESSAAQLGLSRGGELLFGGSGQSETAEETRLDLRRGALALKLAPGKASRIVLPEVTVESLGAAHVDLSRSGKGFSAVARAGDVTLVYGGARQPVRAGERLTVRARGGAATVDSVDRAPFSLPSKSAQQVFHFGMEEVALTWEDVGDADVEVATDGAFKNAILAGRVHGGFVNVPAPLRGALYWRVVSPAGAQVARGSAAFAPEAARKDLARLRNEVPEGAETTTIFYQDKPPTVTFTYRPEPAAKEYKLAVYRAGALSTPVAVRTSPEAKVALEAGILEEGNFMWSVTPLSPKGEPLRGGRMNKLNLVYDNSVPTLVITSPRNRQALSREGNMLATGVAPAGARVAVNGRPAPLDEKHRFSLLVTPVGRPPLVWFKLLRSGAPDLYTVRVLRRGP